MKLNGQGIVELVAEKDMLITVRTQREFTVVVNNELVAPNNALDRYAQFEVKKDDKIHISMDETCVHTVVLKELPNRKEVHTDESILEVIPEGEISMYDRLRNEMLGLVSQYAEAKGMDTFEDDNDYELEDEDEPLIDTPYEYKALIDEIPVEQKEIDQQIEEQVKEIEAEEKIEEKTDGEKE